MNDKKKPDLNSAMPVIFGILAMAVVIVVSVVIIHGNLLGQPDPTPAPEPDPEPTPVLDEDFESLPEPIIEENVPDKGTAFNDFEHLSTYFNVDIEDYDFEEYSYLLFYYEYDECSLENIKPTKYTVNDTYGEIAIDISYDGGCGVCVPQRDYWLLRIPKTTVQYKLVFNYIRLSSGDCDDDPYVVKKPIIYLYPTKTIDVSVKLAHPELLTSSYPRYTDGWQVTAEPSGKLTDRTTGRELYSLYWEGTNRNAKMHSDGFVIKGSDTSDFLEEKLALLGLTDREAEEFIIYWLPVLEQNNYNYIRFETIAEINSYMPLEINPNPDTLIRVIMDYKPLETPIEVTEQKITTPTRTGFTVVEWGGTQIK